MSLRMNITINNAVVPIDATDIRVDTDYSDSTPTERQRVVRLPSATRMGSIWRGIASR